LLIDPSTFTSRPHSRQKANKRARRFDLFCVVWLKFTFSFHLDFLSWSFWWWAWPVVVLYLKFTGF
jgi:hypothetical protein